MKMATKVRNLFEQIARDPKSTLIGLALVLLVWTLAVAGVVWLIFSVQEQPGQALIVPEGQPQPAINIEPATGEVGTFITIWGEEWPANDTVYIYLMSADETEIPNFAIANAITDDSGRFVTGLTLPSGPYWDDQTQLTVIARTTEDGPVAVATFRVTESALPLTDSPTASPEPVTSPTTETEPTTVVSDTIETATPTSTPVKSTASPTATPVPQPAKPAVTANAN
jgi:hypothetical protein